MKPLIVLVSVFIISFFLVKLASGSYQFALPGRIAMSVMLLFTSVAHFKFTSGLAMMLPDVIPYKIAIVYFTGILEIIAAVTLLIPSMQNPTGWFLIAFFIALLPANIYAAFHHIDLETATNTGNGPQYLWFRIPLQLLFLSWIYFAAIKPSLGAD